MILQLLEPILSLHGWPVYAIVGTLVFAEASIMIGFVFPGETAVLLGGVIASRGQVSLWLLMAVVVVCAVAGDSVGYAVGERFGHRLLELRLLKRRRSAIDGVMRQLVRRGAVAVFLARFTAFLRAVVPGLAGMSSMPYSTFLPANAAGGLLWGVGYTLVGYFVGNAYKRAEAVSSWASYAFAGLLVAAFVVIIVRGRRRERRALALEAPVTEGAEGAEPA